MALATFSRFYYGYEITLSSQYINFDEGSGELTARIPLGVYSPTELAEEIQSQLTATGNLLYECVFNRADRSFTISASTNFSLLVNSGVQSSASIFEVIGFSGADRSGLNSYTGTVTGSEYITQFPPQDYIADGFQVEKADASVNTSPDGSVEVVSFAEVSFIEMDLLYITDLPMDGKVIGNNPTGVADALKFLRFLIKKGAVEFMPNKDNLNDFKKVILESTRSSSQGIGFELTEESSKNLPEIYKTGLLRFRKVE